ncbi:MAG: hypothetical protein WCL10_16175, partial [Novosphingobium sp.]
PMGRLYIRSRDLSGGRSVAIIAASAVMIWQPRFAAAFGEMIRHMTVDKGETLSALQRRFWAWQGLDAFVKSAGIGIGPGSFRSSSLATAVLGCTGVIGAAALSLHFLKAFSPLRQSVWTPVADEALSTAAACSWAMLMGIAMASISSATCDPGTDIAFLGGAGLALRRWRPVPPPVAAPSPLAAPPLAVSASTEPLMLCRPAPAPGFAMQEPLILDSTLEIA